ncbi:MAG TPA: tRNA (adenosine(37)-N6)-threonylcarbamoyltransferase complex ATPase subunit type 1 TsaE [Frankiaceae bacterium]|nr:tRNA (adenosine(37)-N6)-threonylcarbamoyltransferase complex ATPase subunit type 1 TsaE [Frankiaceae bacterium]
MIGRELTVATPEAMRELGAALAAVARPGDLVVLAGPLGAGKTVLVQGMGSALGVGVPVTSPTFVIARVHRDGRLPLVHADAYRLSSVDEVDDLDLDASLDESLTVVEWGESLVEGLADAYLRVEIDRFEESEERRVRLVPVGGDWAERLGS